MLEAQIGQKASSSSTPSDRLSNKLEPNPCEHWNCITLKEEIVDLTDPEDVLMEKGREIIMAGSKERNKGGKTATFEENDTVEFAAIFPLSSLTQVVFLSPTLLEK